MTECDEGLKNKVEGLLRDCGDKLKNFDVYF